MNAAFFFLITVALVDALAIVLLRYRPFKVPHAAFRPGTGLVDLFKIFSVAQFLAWWPQPKHIPQVWSLRDFTMTLTASL